MSLLTKLFSITIISFVLASCGNGGSSTSANNTAGSFSAATDKSECLITDSTDQTQTVTTNATGTGNIEGTIPTGLVMMSCTGGTYKDEATGMPTTATMTLRAGVNYTGGVLTIIASPISDVAFRLAMNAGGVTTSTITIQNAVTAKAFGLADDFVSIIPDDLNDVTVTDTPEGKIAVVLAGISQLAMTHGNSATIVINALFNDISGTNGTATAGVLDDINLPTAIAALRLSDTSAANNLKGSTDTITAITTDLAINTIEAYSDSDGNSATALTLADYMAAGINGVIATNLAAANAFILAAGTGDAGSADTATEIQALINNIPIILTITNGTTQVAVIDKPITPEITFASSGGNIDKCEVSPRLPADLRFDITTCTISGTPEATQTATTYTVTATNSAGQRDTATVNLRVREPAPRLADVVQAVVVNTRFTITFNNTGSDVTTVTTDGTDGCTAPNLPNNLEVSVNDRTCEITGTLSATQTATTYTVTAKDTDNQTDAATVTLTVNTPTPVLNLTNDANANQTVLIQGRITPITFDSTTGGTIVGCTLNPLLMGLSVNNATCRITGRPETTQTATTHTVTARNDTGQTDMATVTLTVNVPTPILTNAADLIAMTNTAINHIIFTNRGGTITMCAITPRLPLDLKVSNDCSTISGTPTLTAVQVATTHTVTGTNATGQMGAATVSITVNVPTPILTGPTVLTVVVTGLSITPPIIFANSDSGGAIVSCSVMNPALPDELEVVATATACTIRGIPSGTQTATMYTVTAKNATGQTATASVRLRVDENIVTIANQRFSARENAAFSGLILSGGNANRSLAIISGDPGNVFTIRSGTASALLMADANTLDFATTPTFKLIVQVMAPGAIAQTATITINVNVPAPILANASPLERTVVTGSPITPIIFASSGGAIVSCMNTGNTLPADLSVDLSVDLLDDGTTCAISGTPTVTATQAAITYTVTGMNATGQTDFARVSLIVIPPAPATLTAVATGVANQVRISWAAVTGADSYTLYSANTNSSGDSPLSDFGNSNPSDVVNMAGATPTTTTDTSLLVMLAGRQTVNYLVTATDNGAESFTNSAQTAATAFATAFGTVTTDTSRVWMDRNLGASQVATGRTDALGYGDLYQWGRDGSSNGYQRIDRTVKDNCRNATNVSVLCTSLVSSVKATNIAATNVARVNFITGSGDWLASGDNNGARRSALWGKIDGSSICPTGFNVPTEAELAADTINATGNNRITNRDSAFNSFLKLPTAGLRSSFDGSLSAVGGTSRYWSRTVISSARYLNLTFSGASITRFNLIHAYSVRCIKAN